MVLEVSNTSTLGTPPTTASASPRHRGRSDSAIPKLKDAVSSRG